MTAPGAGLPENQFERTQMAWRRTIAGTLVVLGLGGLHVTAQNHPWTGVLAGIVSLVAIIPMVLRINALRRRDERAATWQPLALVAGLVGMVLVLAFFQ